MFFTVKSLGQIAEKLSNMSFLVEAIIEPDQLTNECAGPPQ